MEEIYIKTYLKKTKKDSKNLERVIVKLAEAISF